MERKEEKKMEVKRWSIFYSKERERNRKGPIGPGPINGFFNKAIL